MHSNWQGEKKGGSSQTTKETHADIFAYKVENTYISGDEERCRLPLSCGKLRVCCDTKVQLLLGKGE